MKQKAGSTKHRAGPQNTPCSLTEAFASLRDWGGSGSLRPATEQRHLAQRRPLQGRASQTAPLYCVWVAEHGSLAPPCSSRGQVLKNKQKDNLRAKATDKDSRKLQAVRFKVREEMRPGRLSLSSSNPWLHTRIAWVFHSSPQAQRPPAMMPDKSASMPVGWHRGFAWASGRDFWPEAWYTHSHKHIYICLRNVFQLYKEHIYIYVYCSIYIYCSLFIYIYVEMSLKEVVFDTNDTMSLERAIIHEVH